MPADLQGLKVLVADDHPLYRAALRGAVLACLPGCDLHEADSVATLLQLVESHGDADLLLLDLNMPGAHGFSALAHLRGSAPQLPVIVVSAAEDPATVAQAIAYGAQGYIPKSADAPAIAAALRSVLEGGIAVPGAAQAAAPHAVPGESLEVARRIAGLTPQQFRVLGMVCSGLLNKQVAWELQVTEATVKAHMTAILRKLGASTRTQAVLMASRLALDPQSLRAAEEEGD